MSEKTITAKRPIFDVYKEFIGGLKDSGVIRDGGHEDGGDEESGKQSKSPEKRPDSRDCGAFLLRAAISPADVCSKDGNKVVSADEKYAEIHMLELSPKEAEIGYIRRSLAQVAIELLSPDFDGADKLMGIIYQRLARTACMFGFDQAELPVSVLQPIHEDAHTVLVYASKTEFMEAHARPGAESLQIA